MTKRSIVVLLTCTSLGGCSDPLDDEPKGQRIPTSALLETRYAAGSGAATGAGSQMQTGSTGGGSGAVATGSSNAESTAGPAMQAMQPGGLASGAQGGGGAATSGVVPPAGLQTTPQAGAQQAGQSSQSGSGGMSGGSASSGGSGS